MTSCQLVVSAGCDAVCGTARAFLQSNLAVANFAKKHKYAIVGGVCVVKGLELAMSCLQRNRPLPKLDIGSYHEITLLDGRQLGYAEFGNPSGIPVLFLHGTPGGRAHGLIMHEDAVRHGVRLITPFRTGYGPSDQNLARTVSDYASDIAALFDHLCIERFAVVGVSGGGAYACAVAHALQDRVTGCALVCSVSPLDPEVIGGMRFGNRLAFKYIAPTFAALSRTPICKLNLRPSRLSVVIQLGLVNRVFDSILKQLANLEGADPNEFTRTFRTPLLADTIDTLEFTRPSNAMGTMVDCAVIASDWGFDIQTITVPTHIWHGYRDVQAPPLCAQRLSVIPGSIVKMLSAGHLGCWVQSRDEALQFLASKK
jgi:pimeloyl-ACP methyl ester carboxylesterase